MTSRLIILLCGLLLLASCGSATRWQDTPQTHIVRSGETLSAIAWRYGKDPMDLARWNRLGDGSLIYPGQVIRLTGTGGTRSTASGNAGKKTTQTTSRPSPRPLPDIPAQPAPDWAWPTDGRIDVGFGAKPGTGTGVLINGRLGQPVNAAASGQVVYAGSGLIGYGKLIILKHNDTFLSAYGYSDALLVKEGDSIRKGQQIATMGEGPERKSRLHFEIRRNGQPVDPGKFLPER
ncbi:MAG: peptidoglycan DD-metalloendopeptidase family protein [Gammaproteobacteria bacterium]|nr:peptidoglycan DD-metalloendopeptidase family protein [Gammaproteobacteria bacterium]